jgi:hypothetical protein
MTNNDFTTIELHSQLNPQLWSGDQLDPKVQVGTTTHRPRILRISRV